MARSADDLAADTAPQKHPRPTKHHARQLQADLAEKQIVKTQYVGKV